MSRRPARHMVVFARAPRLGTVKRRLAADIGAVAALRFYRATLAATLRRLGRDPRWTTWLAVTPDAAVTRDAGWLRWLGAGIGFEWPITAVHVRPQGPGGLGERMDRCFAAAPAGLPPGPVVIVGSDIPDVRPHHVAAAFRALGRAPLVFGPAADGGYWLVGARRCPVPPRGLFDGVRWSSRHALTDTLANAGRLPALFLETLEDVDDIDAYRRDLQRHPCRPSPPPPQGKG